MADDRPSNRSSERVFTAAEVEQELTDDERPAQPIPAAPQGEQQGISNHPAIDEEREQRKLPPRGEAKEEPPDAR